MVYETDSCCICKKLLTMRQRNAYAKYCSWNCKKKSMRKYYKLNGIRWASIVEMINERDNYKCVKCASDKNIVVHHIKMVCDGGTHEESNLITLCSKCHAKIHKSLN